MPSPWILAPVLTVALAALVPHAAAPQEDAPAPQRWVTYAGGAGPGAGKHVVLISGDEEYRSEEALPMLGKLLAVRHGFRCTVLFSQKPETAEIDPEERTYLPGIEAVDDADLVVLFTRFRSWPEADMKHFADYVEAGKPLIALRTATHAFNYPADAPNAYARWTWTGSAWEGGFGKQVLGETWVNHHGSHGQESTRGVIPAAAASHPILRGVTDVWGPTDVYGIRALPADATVLLEGEVCAGMTPAAPPVDGPKNAPRIPVTWTRERALAGGVTQRIVVSTLGAAIDLESEHLRRLLVNAAYWCTGMEDAIPAHSDARTVGCYEPTMFGFGGFVRGVYPKDHALAQ
ncbi:MAG: ThuA domain-containing protein [Planctomycetes bacterium]|nr:ThuA domain-containing protein [Planctomycetota bacterium]